VFSRVEMSFARWTITAFGIVTERVKRIRGASEALRYHDAVRPRARCHGSIQRIARVLPILDPSACAQSIRAPTRKAAAPILEANLNPNLAAWWICGISRGCGLSYEQPLERLLTLACGGKLNEHKA
jgi:hypothetical protein